MQTLLKIIPIIALLLVQERFLSAQDTTNFADWKVPHNAEAVPDWSRRMLVRDFRDLTGDARTERLEKYLAELRSIATDPLIVSSTRYNAILAIGLLVSVEGKPGNPPLSYAAALPCLMEIYQQADSPVYLKYGALLGIVRHTNLGIDPAQQEPVIDLLLKIVKDEFGSEAIIADAAREPAVWNWFRQTALDGLSGLKTTGADGNVVADLLSVMNQHSQELESLLQRPNLTNSDVRNHVQQRIELASKVAKTLGDFDYLTGIADSKAISDSFARLAKAVSDVEQQIISELLTQNNTPPRSAEQIKRIVIDIKTCTQSIAWGIRSGFLTTKPAENSLYVSLQNNEQERKRLDQLWSALIALSIFLDEGGKDKTQSVPTESGGANASSRMFKFDLAELRNGLAQFSASVAQL